MDDLYSLWDYDDPLASAERFALYAGSAPDEAARQEARTQLARALGLAGRYDEAREVAQSALDAAPDARVRAAARLELGRIARSSGDASKGLPDFTEAFNVSASAGEDDIAADAAHMLAIVAPEAEAIQWGLRGIRLAEQSGMARAKAMLGPLHNNLGWTYFERGEHQAALAQFARAQIVREQHGSPRSLHIAKWCVARTLRALNRLDEALAILNALAATELGEADGFVHEELGECLLAQTKDDEAQPHFQKAWALLGEPGDLDHEPARKERLRSLAGVF